jgi:hypothetical protein
MRSLCQYSIPYLMGWNFAFSIPKTVSASAAPTSKSANPPGPDSYTYSEDKPRSPQQAQKQPSSPAAPRKSPSPMWKQ